eukprot:jgi/Galph1/1932/GphlegSOOS_G607.1
MFLYGISEHTFKLPGNLVDDIISLTLERVLNFGKATAYQFGYFSSAIVDGCSECLGALSLFSLEEIRTKLNERISSLMGNSSFSSFFNLRDTDSELLFHLRLMKNLRLSMKDFMSTKSSIRLLEYYRLLVMQNRSTTVKHLIADNIIALLSKDVTIEVKDSVSLAQWYKVIDDLYAVSQKWCSKPKHMAKAFLLGAVLLKAKHTDVMKKELWPFIAKCCKQYEESKDISTKEPLIMSLIHVLGVYVRRKESPTNMTEHITHVIRKLLSPQRTFVESNRKLYSLLGNCVMIAIEFYPHIWISRVTDWWKSGKWNPLSEVSFVFCSVILLCFGGESSNMERLKNDSFIFVEKPREIMIWSSSEKLKLAQQACRILKATSALWDTSKSQTTFLQDIQDLYGLLQIELQSVACLLDYVDNEELQTLYPILTELACYHERIFGGELEKIILELCRRMENAKESIINALFSKLCLKRTNPLDISVSHVTQVLEVLYGILEDNSPSADSNNDCKSQHLRTTLYKIQEALILLHAIPLVDFRKTLVAVIKSIHKILFQGVSFCLNDVSLSNKDLSSNSFTTSKSVDDILSQTSAILTYSYGSLDGWRDFLSYVAKQSPEQALSGCLEAEKIMLSLKATIDQGLQGNVKEREKFPNFYRLNMSYGDAIETYFFLFFYVVCSSSVDNQPTYLRQKNSKSSTEPQKLFQSLLSPVQLGFETTKSSLCTSYCSQLLDFVQYIPSKWIFSFGLEAERILFPLSPSVLTPKGRIRRQRDNQRLFYAKLMLTMLSSLTSDPNMDVNEELLDLYSRYFSRMRVVLTNTEEIPQNPFDLMALRETYCCTLLKAFTLFEPFSGFAKYLGSIWKETLQLMLRWSVSKRVRKSTNASRTTSIFRHGFHEHWSREVSLTVEDLQEKVTRLSYILVTVFLGHHESFGINKDDMMSISFSPNIFFSNLLEVFKPFDDVYFGKFEYHEILKPALLRMLQSEDKTLKTLIELTLMSNDHSNEVIAYHAAYLLFDYIVDKQWSKDMIKKDEVLVSEIISVIYFMLGWSRDDLHPLALQALVCIFSLLTKDFKYEIPLQLHQFHISSCQDENLVLDISRRGAVLCSFLANHVVLQVLDKLKNSLQENIEYDYPRIMINLLPWLEKGNISENVVFNLFSLEKSVMQDANSKDWLLSTFDSLWHACGSQINNLKVAIEALQKLTNQTLNQLVSPLSDGLWLVRKVCATLSCGRVDLFLPIIFSPTASESGHDNQVPLYPLDKQSLDAIPLIVIMSSEVIQRNKDDIRSFLSHLCHSVILSQTMANASFVKHGRLLLANLLSRFVLSFVERCYPLGTWSHVSHLCCQVAVNLEQLTNLDMKTDIAGYPKSTLLHLSDSDAYMQTILDQIIQLCSYCEPNIRSSWSQLCLSIVQQGIEHPLSFRSLWLYRLLRPRCEEHSLAIFLSRFSSEIFSQKCDELKKGQLLKTIYKLAESMEKEQVMMLPNMLHVAYQLALCEDAWLRFHGAFLFDWLFSLGNSFGEGIFFQLIEKFFISENIFQDTLELCRLAIITTEISNSELTVFLFLALLLRIPISSEISNQKQILIPLVFTLCIFLTSLLTFHEDDWTDDDELCNIYKQTVPSCEKMDASLNSPRSVFIRVLCIHLCHILQWMNLSSLSQILQNLQAVSGTFWKMEDFLYQLRVPLLDLWVKNVHVCQEIITTWLETNGVPIYRQSALRVLEALILQAGQQNIMFPLEEPDHSRILKVLVSSLNTSLHDEVIHLLELLE